MKPSLLGIRGLLLSFSLIGDSVEGDTIVLTEPLERGVVIPEVAPDAAFTSVAGIGDFEGDGIADFAVSVAERAPSSVYLVLGRPQFPGVFDLPGLDGAAKITSDFPAFGKGLAAAGDLDGDGLPEILVEASALALDAGGTLGTTYLIPGASLFGPKLFTRGDVDLDGELNITDAIVILGVLFLGSPRELACKDAADTNDDGKVDLSDAVFFLRYLFLGGENPPPPFPDAGIDPTAGDALDCAGFQAG